MKNLTTAFAEILGLLCSEGTHIISHSSYWGKDKGKRRYFKNDKSERIEFFNKDKRLLKRYRCLLLKEFDYRPKITKYGKVNICKMSIIKEIIKQTRLGHLKWKVPYKIMDSTDKIKIAFLRGYFDGDGTMSKSIRMFSTNKKGLNQVSRLLDDLNFEYTFQGPEFKENRKPLHILHVNAKEKERFLKTINPTSKRPGQMRGL